MKCQPHKFIAVLDREQQGSIKFLKKFVWEEHQVVKSGREIHGCGEEYNLKKGKGEAIAFSL